MHKHITLIDNTLRTPYAEKPFLLPFTFAVFFQLSGPRTTFVHGCN